MSHAARIACFVALSSAGCSASSTASHLPAISQDEWTTARARLTAFRATQPRRPYVAQLRVGMREPRSGKTFEGRGALAVQPHTAMRMILVGPGGNTALDVWVTRDRWRFTVPAVDFRKSGDADPASSRGLPIGFFRWWFLAPLDGRLLSAALGREGPTYLLRDGGGTVILHEGHEAGALHLVALRRETGASQALEWLGHDFTPHAGDHARYVETVSGLQVEVLVEGISPEEPDPGAFLDPDDPGVPL